MLCRAVRLIACEAVHVMGMATVAMHRRNLACDVFPFGKSLNPLRSILSVRGAQFDERPVDDFHKEGAFM